MSDKGALLMAEQQITGFTSAAKGETIVDLAESMGLSAEEWAELQSNDGLAMRAEDVRELNEHYS